MSEALEIPAEPINPELEGMTFAEQFQFLMRKAPSSDTGLQAFEAILKVIEDLCANSGVAFDRTEYWNVDKIRGDHPVIPEGVGDFVVPAIITEEAINRFIEVSTSIYAAQNVIRNASANSGQPQRGQAMLDQRILVRTVQSAPMYLVQSEDSEEDDFL